MAKRLFGLETEYAFAPLGVARSPDAQTVGRFWHYATRSLAHLPASGGHGVFLQNGSRFYIDCGAHPEMTTPECTNPWDAVRYVEAGDRVLATAAAGFAKADPTVSDALVFKANVDYTGARTTWGCHESYLHKAHREDLARHLIPFLVSRIIFAGAGGFDPFNPGLVFTLSPRAWHMRSAISSESTHDRGIFHTKNEPLAANGCSRLHVLCAESLCSQTASWLRVGATALVVALIEAGLRPGDAVTLQDRVGALRVFALDPECKATVPRANGAPLSALDIQRHYLALAEANATRRFMPPWAEEVCHHWREILDRLARGPAAVATTLDWAIKGALFESRALQRGVPWETWPAWTHVATRLSRALATTQLRGKSISVPFLLGPNNPIPDEIKLLTDHLECHQLSWDGLQPFLSLREELFEIDWRFAQLGPDGIFAALDQAGVLSHRFPGVDNIEHAMANPPAEGRARLRGNCVRRFASDPAGRACDWQIVLDYRENRMLDLSDPFAAEEKWHKIPRPHPRRDV